jgi:hypothetical protein
VAGGDIHRNSEIYEIKVISNQWPQCRNSMVEMAVMAGRNN